MTMAYLQTEDFTHTLLSPFDLISLTDAKISGGTLAMRALNKEHLERLVLSNPKNWPDIKVTLCSAGYIVIDGYHRWEACKIKQLKALYATCETYQSESEIIEAAFRANLFHGQQASSETRGDYAYWLHLMNPTMEQTEIARSVGISQAAVSKAIAKREQEARPDGEMLPEEYKKLLKKSCRRFSRIAVRFLDEVEGLEEQELTEMFQTVVKRDEDRAKLIRVARLLDASHTVPL
jgi:predicted transcriptional regulator